MNSEAGRESMDELLETSEKANQRVLYFLQDVIRANLGERINQGQFLTEPFEKEGKKYILPRNFRRDLFLPRDAAKAYIELYHKYENAIDSMGAKDLFSLFRMWRNRKNLSAIFDFVEKAKKLESSVPQRERPKTPTYTVCPPGPKNSARYHKENSEKFDDENQKP